jgi:hypothetical protein
MSTSPRPAKRRVERPLTAGPHERPAERFADGDDDQWTPSFDDDRDDPLPLDRVIR